MSQQAASVGTPGARAQHINIDQTLRDRTREALLASVPDANVPERHDGTYDHMAKWTQQQELGAVARYELTQGIVSPVAIRHGEPETGLPVAAQIAPHTGTTSPISTPSTSPVSTPHPGSSKNSQQASFTSTSTATTETSATDNSTTIGYPPDYLPPKPSTPLSIRGFVSIVNGRARVLPASTLQLHSVSGSPARLGEVEYPTTPRPSTPRSIRRGLISIVDGQATVLPGSRLGLHTVPDSPAQSDEAASAQKYSGPADSTTKLKGKANRLVDKVRSSVRRHVNDEPSFVVERRKVQV